MKATFNSTSLVLIDSKNEPTASSLSFLYFFIHELAIGIFWCNYYCMVSDYISIFQDCTEEPEIHDERTSSSAPCVRFALWYIFFAVHGVDGSLRICIFYTFFKLYIQNQGRYCRTVNGVFKSFLEFYVINLRI